MSVNIMLLGNTEVGKTTFLQQYIKKTFKEVGMMTVGVDSETVDVIIDNEKKVSTKIWDTAGQERFRNITNLYYKGADGIILVFDVTDQKSFEKIKEWMSQITANTQADQIGLVLLGNKCDIEPRTISKNDGEELGKELGIEYYETSAMKGDGIAQAFEFLAKNILTKKKIDLKNEKGTDGGVNLDGGVTPQKKQCCK